MVFRKVIEEITMLMVYETCRDLPLEKVDIATPIKDTEGHRIEGNKRVLLPILRAGLGMVQGFLNVVPSARVGHIGMYRNEDTLEPHFYYYKVPRRSDDRLFIIVDPMLATGGSANLTIGKLKENNIRYIKFMAILASPEGIAKVEEAHPDVNVYVAKIDESINQKGYILPGLGDAGDRIFGTK